MAKKVAETLKGLQGSEIYKRILDPKDAIDDVIAEMRGRWAFDPYSRSPAPALLEDGALTPTDLDMAAFLSALADRGAVINLPTYRSRRPRTLRDDEWVISRNNRHGKMVGLTSNKDVFSFSVLMVDGNVVKRSADEKDQTGAFRNFMVVDLDGHFYDGWHVIEWDPTRKENAFLTENKLWTRQEDLPGGAGNKVYFKNFVHPNRWTSFYGQPYVLTKILIARLKAEARDLTSQLKALRAAAPVVDEEEERPATSAGPSATEKVKAFEAAVEAPVPEKGFPIVGAYGKLGLEVGEARLKKIRYADVPALQFAIRATELAFCQHARSFDALADGARTADDPAPGPVFHPEPFPAWIKGASFEDYKDKRTVWRRLVLHQRAPFAPGLALRYRVRWKSERVAA